MGNLLTSLLSSAGAMRAFERSLAAIGNNVANASTPGYARSRVNPEPLPFDPAAGLPGGVQAGRLESTRDEFLEAGVRRQASFVGQFTQRGQEISQVEQYLAIGENAGIPGALNKLFQEFSQLAAAPNDAAARQQILDQAGALASQFNQCAAALGRASADADDQIRGAVSQINSLVGRIREVVAARIESTGSQDAGADAQIHDALESLAELVDITVVRASDGSLSILLGDGQTPLLLGLQQFEITSDPARQGIDIRNTDGEAITSQIQHGKLGGLLEFRNRLVPAFSAGLDRLARSIADRVNETLGQGMDANGAPGKDLFTYAAAAPALTLAVGDIDPAELAAALAEAPGGNGNALKLAALAGDRPLDGYTFSQFYGNLAAQAGRERAASEDNHQLHAQLLAQARAFRQEVSGVSLDEEAARLIEFQRAYQASARLLSILDDLTQSVIDMVQ